jgi:hypothetical protein
MPLTKTPMMMFNGRSAKPWDSFGEAAANLEMVALDSRVSKATRLIMLASFSLMTMTGMEVAVADPIVTQQVFQVEHVKIDSTKKFAERIAQARAADRPGGESRAAGSRTEGGLTVGRRTSSTAGVQGLSPAGCPFPACVGGRWCVSARRWTEE